MANSSKIKNSEKIQNLITSASRQNKAWVAAVPLELIHFLGDTKKAVLLAQIIYLSDRGARRDGYIYKTYKQMTELTGLSEDQIRKYYKEFKNQGFLVTKTKKANAVPTVHFKFYMSVFSKPFQEFLGKRYLNNSGNDSLKSQESLTKNTNKDNTLSLKKNKEREFLNEELNDEENITDSWDYFDYPDLTEKLVPLPENFYPTLENQFWTVTNFTSKSPKLATGSFKGYYDGKSITKTHSGWQEEWRKWMINEIPPKGYDLLEDEQHKIKQDVQKIVFEFVFKSRLFLASRASFYNILQNEEFSFSKETIDECLRELLSEHRLQILFDDYYYVPDSVEYNGQKKNGSIWESWDEMNPAIYDFIFDNGAVTVGQIFRKFQHYDRKSLEICLGSMAKVKKLERIGHYFFFESEYIDNSDYQSKVDAKLRMLAVPA